MDEELDRFKRYDLRAYAASLGFVIDRRASSRGSTVMRRGDEKIIVSRRPDGCYSYWSPHDDADRGSIIDLLQRRSGGMTLGAVRRELRQWMGGPPPAAEVFHPLAVAAKDFDAVRRRFEAMRVVARHPYLTDERGIPEALLRRWRFSGRVKMDAHGAAVFPHFDPRGEVCGFELKNRDGFTGFASGGTKTAWMSHGRDDDTRLVLCESSIDALSHAAIFDDPAARYASTAGKMSGVQRDVVRALIEAMPAGAEIVAASDADDAGHEMAKLVGEFVRETGRGDLTFRRDAPTDGRDWNDVLRARKRLSPLPAKPEPSVG